MSVWLDSSSNSNKFKQSYFRNFIDVSGDILVRNGLSLKLYDNNNNIISKTDNLNRIVIKLCIYTSRKKITMN